MLYLLSFALSFLLLSASVATLLVLAIDAVVARYGVERRIDRSQGMHWAPRSGAVLEDPVAGASLLPAGARPKLWVLVGAATVLGSLVLVLAS